MPAERGRDLNPRPPKYQFLLDENFPVKAGKFLKSKGHNVISVVERKKLRELSDLALIKEANKQIRVFIALDKDFIANESLRELIKKGPGVILVKSSDPQAEKVIIILGQLLKKMSEKKIIG